jgi:DASS family divalent anion:Na+ symporter
MPSNRTRQGNQGKVGTYLALVNYHSNPITSAMFLTATAPNPLVVDLVAKATGQSLHLSWTSWALYMLLPAAVSAADAAGVYSLSPPELKATPNAVEYARAEMAGMGPAVRQER